MGRLVVKYSDTEFVTISLPFAARVVGAAVLGGRSRLAPAPDDNGARHQVERVVFNALPKMAALPPNIAPPAFHLPSSSAAFV